MFSALHIEPVGGVAGDMVLAALLDLGADANAVRSAFARFEEPGLTLSVDTVHVGDVRATYVRSLTGAPTFRKVAKTPFLKGRHQHGHTTLGTILATIRAARLSAGAAKCAEYIFSILAEAEASVHGGSMDNVGLHEVGELDSIMDVVGIAVALDSLQAPAISCAPLPSGQGTVMTSHGELQCPVPAVVALCGRFSVPLEVVDVRGETVTPTGAAVVAATAGRFTHDIPTGVTRVGTGAGTKRFVTRPNIVRIHGVP